MCALIFDVPTYDRNTSIEVIPFEKLIDELKYMGIKTLGQLLDDFDAIMDRIEGRFPEFYFNEDYSREDIKSFLAEIE